MHAYENSSCKFIWKLFGGRVLWKIDAQNCSFNINISIRQRTYAELRMKHMYISMDPFQHISTDFIQLNSNAVSKCNGSKCVTQPMHNPWRCFHLYADFWNEFISRRNFCTRGLERFWLGFWPKFLVDFN